MALKPSKLLSGNGQAEGALERVDRARWNELAADFDDFNYQQTWAYGEALAARRGAGSEHVAIHCGTDLIGLADVRIKRVPVFGGGLSYVTSGPLIRRRGGDDPSRLECCLRSLVREYVQTRGLTLRVLPCVRPTTEGNSAVAECFERAGLVMSSGAERYRTIVLDLGQPAAALRAALAGKWRNCLNAGRRAGLRVILTTADADFDRFAALFEAFVSRKGYEVDLDARFYAAVQRELPDDQRLAVGLAYEGDELVAGSVTAMHGDTAVYLLGATSEAGLKTKASYVLQWSTIELAQQRGMRWYDLGGIDPGGNPGVHHFKRGMGGADVCAAGPFEKAPDAIRGAVLRAAEHAYRRARRWKRRSPMKAGRS